MSLDLKTSASLAVPVEGIEQLTGYIRGAEKPPAQWLVGVEHEKLGVVLPGPSQDLTVVEPPKPYSAVPYYGEGGIRCLLDKLARAAGGSQHSHKENGQPIAVLSNGASVTLEPGGQLELSGAPFRSLGEAGREIQAHLDVVRKENCGAAWLAAGYRPFGTREEVAWMPKGRYGAMRKSLGPRGRLALDMMLMTATVQANLDFSDERDLAAKARAATSASPIVAALFANSPLVDGKPSGYLDFRYQVWRECDPARCGLLPIMVEPEFGYEAYTRWALSVPMLFVRNGSDYRDAQGQTFGQWLKSGRLLGDDKPSKPTLSHWVDHLSTLFPEIRVKRVLEVRGADVVPPPLMLALPALWVGLLYDRAACAGAWELTAHWSFAERLAFQEQVALHALKAKGPGGVSALDLARELLALARAGLSRWGRETGVDESALLDPAFAIAQDGVTLAERALDLFRAAKGDPAALIRFWQIA